jgi:transposase
MGEDRAASSRTPAFAQGRTQVHSQSALLRRHPVDSVDGRALVRPAQAISQRLDLLAEAQRLARRRHMGKRFRQFCRPTQRAGTVALGRNFYRRDVRARKKRGLGVGKTKRGKGTKVVVVADGEGLPVGLHVCSASPHEATLAETTVAAAHGRPKRLIGDRAYDSDPLRERLARLGIELIAPHRRGRIKPPTQDGRPLRRYRRRWKVERLFAWLNNYRRLVVRWEHHPNIYRAFLLVAFIMILAKRL